jgi:hypothetical protein
MANEIKTKATPASTVYVRIFNSARRVYRVATAAFEIWDLAHVADYAVPMTEAAPGIYFADFPAGQAAGVYLCVAYLQAGGSPAGSDAYEASGELYWDGSKEVNPLTIGGKTDLIDAKTVVTLAPQTDGRHLTLVAGDDYLAADGRAIDFVKQAGDAWPADLTGATVSMTLKRVADNATGGDDTPITIDQTSTPPTSILVATGDAQAVRVPIPSAVTGALGTGAHAYEFAVEATLADGSRARLAQGTATVMP